jgi:hypothetical protein
MQPPVALALLHMVPAAAVAQTEPCGARDTTRRPLSRACSTTASVTTCSERQQQQWAATHPQQAGNSGWVPSSSCTPGWCCSRRSQQPIWRRPVAEERQQHQQQGLWSSRQHQWQEEGCFIPQHLPRRIGCRVHGVRLTAAASNSSYGVTCCQQQQQPVEQESPVSQ